jgi:hypothetical protein
MPWFLLGTIRDGQYAAANSLLRGNLGFQPQIRNLVNFPNQDGETNICGRMFSANQARDFPKTIHSCRVGCLLWILRYFTAIKQGAQGQPRPST